MFASVSPDVGFVGGANGGDVSGVKAVLDHFVMTPGALFEFRIMIVLAVLVVFVEVDFKIVNDLHLGQPPLVCDNCLSHYSGLYLFFFRVYFDCCSLFSKGLLW